jgi:hypothetical protein
MIRLVHQFDSPSARPSVAAPKSSGCCCCCCCCLATLVGSSILTARADGKGFVPRPVGGAANEAAGPTESPFRPSGPELPVPNMRTIPQRRWKVLGFFLLPIALTLGFCTMAFHIAAGWLVMLVSYLGGLFFLRHKAGLRGWMFAVLLVGIPLLTVLEAIVWIAVVFK